MRQIKEDSQEAIIVKKLIDTKNTSNLKDLLASSILSNYLDFNQIVIKWDKNPQNITFFKKNDKDVDVDVNIHRLYIKLCNYLYFIKELSDNNLIKIQSITSDELSEKQRILFNSKKYTFNKLEENGSLIFFWEIENKDDKTTYSLVPSDSQIYYLDIIEDLEKYIYNKMIYPLPLLEEYYNNKYKSIEQVHFDSIQKRSLIALWFSAFALVLTFFGTCHNCSLENNKYRDGIKINEKQFDAIKKIINNNTKISSPRTIYLDKTELKNGDSRQQ